MTLCIFLSIYRHTPTKEQSDYCLVAAYLDNKGI